MKNQADELQKIRMLMERSTIYNSLSGLSGIAAGAVAIVAYFVYNIMIDRMFKDRSFMQLSPIEKSETVNNLYFLSIATLLIAFGGILFFNFRKSQKASLPFLNGAMKNLFINLFIPLVAGGIYCIILVREEQYLLIAPSMLVFYGLGMINASRHSILEIRNLGIAELILGLIALFFKDQGLIFWVIGFGVINICYGAYIYFNHERKLNY